MASVLGVTLLGSLGSVAETPSTRSLALTLLSPLLSLLSFSLCPHSPSCDEASVS